MALLATCVVATGEAETVRYVLRTSDGKPAGEQVVEREPGQTKVRYVFKDNGRGPELDERIVVGPDGAPVRYDVVGTSTFGATVDEHFERRGDDAAWHSTSERGNATAGGSALYVPLNGSLEAVSLSLGLVDAAPAGRLALLPSGALTQRVVDVIEVERGGERKRVRLLAQVGLGFQPALYWATDEPHPRLFAAIITGWLSALEEGWDASLDVLAEHQAKAEAALLRGLAARTRHPLPGLTVIRNARVFDSRTSEVGPPSDLYLLRGRITALRPAGGPPGGADNEIDAAGRIVLPGLFDMHAHVGRWDGGLHLAAGVTTVRDMGNDNRQLQAMLDETARGDVLLPQIVPAGFLEGKGPNAAQQGIHIETLQQATDAIDWYAARGYPQLKIYNSFPRDLVRDTVAYAHARGMRVSGHVPVYMRAQDVVEQGFDEIQHMNQVMLNFLVTPTTDTRTLERFYLPAEKGGALDLDSKPVQDFIALLVRKHTVIDPTLTIHDLIRQRDGEPSAPYEPVRQHLPPDVQRGLFVGALKIPDEVTGARYDKSYAKIVEFVGRLHRAGVPLVAGTDSTPGFTLQAELEGYVKAGLSPPEVLQIATRNGARYSRTEADRGAIEVGKRADLILVDGDPTKDIADIRKVALVVTQDSVLVPTEIYHELGIAPFVDAVPTIRTATGR